MYDFDRVIDRFGTDCVKYDAIGEECGSSDILPMWVADMDFQSPPAVREAVRQCCEHGVFGYTFRRGQGRLPGMGAQALRVGGMSGMALFEPGNCDGAFAGRQGVDRAGRSDFDHDSCVSSFFFSGQG